jgi:hypothetical protein
VDLVAVMVVETTVEVAVLAAVVLAAVAVCGL